MNSDDRIRQNLRRSESNSTQRAAQNSAQSDVLSELCDRVLSAALLSPEDVNLMSKKQAFTSYPNLALAFYYCTATNPACNINGDEQVCEEEGKKARDRIVPVLDDLPTAEDFAECQRLASSFEAESNDIWACASCGRILLAGEGNDGEINFQTLHSLRASVLLTTSEREDLFRSTPLDVVRQYRQVYFDDDDIYYLIPELVKDRNKIPLCGKCNKNPRNSKFSVANGNDYGRIGTLPQLNDPTLSCVRPARGFGTEISLSGKHSAGHVICFPSDGPTALAQVLPNVDPACMPRVTFIDPKDEWRIQQKKYQRLFSIQVEEAYKWLSVLACVNDIFITEEILIDDSSERRSSLHAMSACIEASVHVTDSNAATNIQEQAVSERFGSDVNNNEGNGNASSQQEARNDSAPDNAHDVVIRSSAVLPNVIESSSPESHAIIDAMLQSLHRVTPHGPSPSTPTTDDRGMKCVLIVTAFGN